MIAIASPIIGEEEIAAVNQVLESGVLAQGPKVAELEEKFADYCGTKYAVAVNSGTAALHAALYAAGVGPGDEVITVPFSFIATINPIIMLGATPVLVDIDSKTFNMDTTLLSKAITSKTKAILPVHLYGQPANMDEINELARKHNLKIIEDACQAIGAEYRGKKAGSLGDMGCFSLYATKNIMSGEGGVITTNDGRLVEKMKQFRQHGMSGPYQYEGIGFNYRMTDLQAAIAVEQLKKVDDLNQKRVQNAKAVTKGISGLSGISVPFEAEDRTHVYHQYTIKVAKDRDNFVQRLREKQVGAGVYYPLSLHQIPHIAKYGYKLGDFKYSEGAAGSVVSLPIHPKLTEEDIKTIVEAVKDAAA